MSWRNVAALVLVLCVAMAARAEAKKKLLLVGHPPDGHPPATHEYVAGLRVLAKCLEPVAGLEVSSVRADGPWKEGPELIERSDGVVLFVSEGAKWVQAQPERQRAFERLAARGGGLSVLHWGMGTREAGPIEGFVKLFGACHGGPDRKYKVAELDAELPNPKHAILTGIAPFRVKDEFYYRLKRVPSAESILPLVRVPLDGEQEMVAWAYERPEGGRSFGFSGLHFHDNWNLREYRRLVAQGVLWTVKLPVPKEGLTVAVSEDEIKLK